MRILPIDAVLAVVVNCQLIGIFNTDRPTLALAQAAFHQVGEMEKQSIAFDQSSVVERAYLFVEDPALISGNPYGTGRTELIIQYIVRNFGESPAIITNLASHLFLGLREPDPADPNPASPHEDTAGPAIFLGVGGLIGGHFFLKEERQNGHDPFKDVASTIVMPAISKNTLRQTFIFVNPGRPEPKRKMWLYVNISYLDVFNFPRATCYFADALGGGNSPIHKTCNNWN